ncbi:MAG TPA: STAS domain-containing protein [Mycobacteriales bacterium]|jgi:anti-sigma B factor antagonist|nr:STAS domain-containing protein [Mycobacteriales bacterium]
MGLTVGRTSAPDGEYVVVAGEVDIETAPQLRSALAAAVGTGAASVVIDLAAVTYLDSSGLSVLVSAHQRARAQGSTLCLCNPSERVRSLLRITGLDTVLQLDPA